MTKYPDKRFTVSIAAEVAEAVDGYVATAGNTNRSVVVEQALELWNRLAKYPNKHEVLETALRLYEEQQEMELYRSYYASLSPQARAEDASWTKLSEQQASR